MNISSRSLQHSSFSFNALDKKYKTCHNKTADSISLHKNFSERYDLKHQSDSIIHKQTRHPYDKTREDYYITNIRVNGPYRFINVEIIKRGTLADFYDIDEITDVYKKHDIIVDISNLYVYFNVELSDLFTGKFSGYEYPNPSTLVKCIVTGLGLGYPIESTVGFIQG